MAYELYFLQGLAFTILTELLMGLGLTRLFPKQFSFSVKGWRLYLFIAAATFMTLPYVWFVWPYLVHDKGLYRVLSEVWVLLMEAVFYFFALKTKFKKALLFSFLLNAFSFGVGLLIKF